MKAFLICLLTADLIVITFSACLQGTVLACGRVQKESFATAFSPEQMCIAFKTYVKCLSDSDCFGEQITSVLLVSAQKYIKTSCVGHMITASVMTIMLTVFSVCFK